LLEEELRVEDVDAHRGQRTVGLAGDVRRVLRLLDEVDDTPGVIDPHDAEFARLVDRYIETGDRHVGLMVA